MKTLSIFMVICMVFVSVGNIHTLQVESKKDCCLHMERDLSCPHQKQNCGHGMCNANICYNNLVFTALNSVPVKVLIPLVKEGMINRYLNRNLPVYSATNFWHPPQV
ncbi:hypothetical protein [Pedobacter sp. NJ-S-72]